MMRYSTVSLFCAVLLFASAHLSAANGTWHSFHLRDINGPVRALARGPNGEIYAGGSFTEAGGVAAANIARWHNGTWSALGSGVSGGTQPVVDAIAINGDGTVYAAGLFTTAGGKTAGNIASWDGQGWTALSSGSNGRITSLATGNGGTLFAAGQFTSIGGKGASGIAQWFSGQWSALGTGLHGGEQLVNALHFSNGALYVGGNFNDAGGTPASNIAKWEGQTWSALGAGITEYSGVVYDITTIGNAVVAAGSFALPGEVTTANIRSWNGTTWQNLGYFDGPVYAFLGGDPAMIAAGDFLNAGLTASSVKPAAHIAAGTGMAWASIGTGVSGPVYSLLADSTSLLLGGDFSIASGVVTHGIARVNATTWSSVSGVASTSVDGTIHTIAQAPNGDIYVGGSFTTAGSTTASSIARWDGKKWNALGTGVNGTVQALAIDSKGIVYAGGDFTRAGSVNSNAIARWNGTQWESMNTNATYTRVYALAVNESGTVYAGGLFSSIGSTSANNVARWINKTWLPMNTGVDATVNAMAYRGGRLYIGGEFTAASGGPLNGVGEWNGAEWIALKGGVEGSVLAMAVAPNGKLYVGGDLVISSKSANRIAVWDGSQWSAMGSGMNHDVSSLAVDSSGVVYASGLFTMAGGNNAEKIAAWSNGTWSALTSGITGMPVALMASKNMVFVGGNFGMAGGMPSHNFASWMPCSMSPVISSANPRTFCTGDSVTIAVEGTYVSYLWNTGATTPTITVKQPGSYSVTVTNLTGCSALTPAIIVTMNTVALKLNNEAEFCAGDSVRIIASGAMSYQWEPAEGLSCTDCAAPFAKPSSNTVYTVTAMSLQGCTSTATISVMVYPAPAKPTIEQAEALLSCPAQAATYQWMRDGVPIAGANSNTYTVPEGQSGWFSVRIVDNNGCTAISDSVFVNLSTAVGEGQNPESALVLAGSDRSYTVQFTPARPASMTLVVADVLGRTVFTSQQAVAAQHTVPVELQGVAPGLYIVHVSTEGYKWTKTIVIK